MRVKRRKGGLIIVRISSLPLLLHIPLLFLLLALPSNAFEEVRCKTIDIRNKPKMWTSGGNTTSGKQPLNTNCTVLEGSFLMSMVKDKYGNLTNNDFPRFENIREITGSVLFFQVDGLTSLGHIFPNLRVIGGQNLIQHYSLIIYQNNNLKDLGLDNLRLIRNGGVRIAENAKLCNAKSIDWNRLQSGPINDVLVDDASEITISEGTIAPCEPCKNVHKAERCLVTSSAMTTAQKPEYACWSSTTCQLVCPHDPIVTPATSANVTRPGCDDETWSACHAECVAGCSRPNDPSACYACAHISHEGRCVPKCPPTLFSFMNRRCIEKKACESMTPRQHNNQVEHWKAVEGRCHYQCPEHFEDDPNDPKQCRRCGAECIRKCPGNVTVDSLSKARTLERCNVVDGFLEIEMRIGMDSVPATELTQAFSRIQVIDGYLLIRLSPSFVNLHMFKGLTTITGRILYRDKYSVAVYENPNLQKLFPVNPKFNVTSGYLQFQNNRMLCFHHIEELMKALDRTKEMDEFDQSRNSNGDKAICSESSFKVNVSEVTATSFTLAWAPYNTTDMDYRKFLGYEIMYKEVNEIDKNLSIDDDRSACSDSWNSHFKEVKTSVSEGGHVLTDLMDNGRDEVAELLGEERRAYRGPIVEVQLANELIKPNTIYAYYVTTSMVRHEGAHNAVSEIGFVQTHFGPPDPPKITKSESRGTDTLYVEWEPPLRPNGQITHYVITYRPNNMGIDKKAIKSCKTGDIQPLSDVMAEPPNVPSQSQSIFLSTVAPDTCAAKGCCACPVDSKATSLESEEPQQHGSSRVRRSIISTSRDKDLEDNKNAEEADARVENLMNQIVQQEMKEKPKLMNSTATNITLTGLNHYTFYFISISACQNTSAPKHHCSTRKAWISLRTQPIPIADVVDNKTIKIEFVNGTTSSVKITWKAPESPNGFVIAYKVKMVNTAMQSTPVEDCADVVDSYKSHEDGIILHGLSDGDYRVEVRTVSLFGVSSSAVREELFHITTPGWWTIDKIIITAVCVILFLALAGLLGYYFVKRYYGEKVREYATQLISANPEYLSQNDVYKPDEWELKRDSLELREEIGKGTFGNVFRGWGHNITSCCGDHFGTCAIKTVAESANNAERIHFLLEASVMKKFKSEFIVKLYGVVSDGQPVLVVMEMMELGNLRDYLRSRRPGSDENDSALCPPTEVDMCRWAAQIADGMAYLESQRFCHRDLAARNCMVHSPETVKIGDFGMTRDLCYREYYKPAGRRMMPVRWMAPESLVDGRHDMKSDVWSYGVVLYEMWTLGQQPYQGLGNEQIIDHIARKRHVLEQPEACPDRWYMLMVECWKYVPRDRPNFFQIVRELLNIDDWPDVGDTFRNKSFVAQNPQIDSVPYEEPTYVPEGHGMGMLPMDISTEEDNYIGKSKNIRGANGPALFGEEEALASGDHNGIAEHSV